MRYIDERDEQYPIDQLPRKPQPSVTTSSHHEPKRSSRHYATEDARRPRYERADPSGYSTERTRSSSRERRRRERRAARYAEDPEEELRRRERRHARKAEREQRHADRQKRRAEIEAQRAERDERRQRRREAEAGQQVQAPVSNKQRGIPEETSQPTDQKYSQNNTAYQQDQQSEVLHQQRNQGASDTAPNPQNYDLEQGRGHARKQSKRYYSGPPPRAESWESYSSDYYDDDEKYPYSPSESVYGDEKYYRRRSARDRYEYEDSRSCCACRRKWCILGSIAATIIGLIIIIVVAVVASKDHFKYTPSTAQVNSTAAFRSGGATQSSVNDTKDGIGAGNDVYKYYQGNATNFPNHTLWISFEDMWNHNLDNIRQSCGWLDYGSDDSDQEVQDIYNAIQDRANASLVDHRLILALVLQESHGCVRVPHTTSSGGVKNTGLMQAHDGHEYSSHHSDNSILLMIQDGTQGTKKGDGLVQLLNVYGNPYSAARGYNSGYIPTSGDLSEAAGATACYVSDVANRLTGWVNAESSCPGDTS